MIRINNTQYCHFLQQADALRRSGSLCDAIISVKTQTFKAHRLVLACASRTLAQQLAQGNLDNPAHCILEYFLPHTFQQVLDFTYTQALEVPEKDLTLLLKAAQLLEMQSLEDQCREQLQIIGAREIYDSVEIADVKMEYIKENDEKPITSPVPEDRVKKAFSPMDEVNPLRENLLPINPSDSQNDSKFARKKFKTSPASGTFCSRESVITRPSPASSSFSTSWTLPTWDAEMRLSTLRQIAEKYSNFMAGHPFQSPNQSSVVYPFSIYPQHMFPLLGPHFQTPLSNSATLGYSPFLPHYTQNSHAGTTRMGGMIKHGLSKRKRSGQKILTETLQTRKSSYTGLPEVHTERAEDCQDCRPRVGDDQHLRGSDHRQLGKSCAGCRFCGKDATMQHRPESKDHRGEKPYQCKHCPKKFSLKHQLDTHLRVHTGEKPFECRLCGQRSRDYSAMIKHLRTHGGASPYQCTVCLEFCNSLIAMQRHVKNHAVQDFPPGWSIDRTYLYISHI